MRKVSVLYITKSIGGAAALAQPADRTGAGVVERDSQANVGISRGIAVGRVERNPAEIVQIGLGSRVAGETDTAV